VVAAAGEVTGTLEEGGLAKVIHSVLVAAHSGITTQAEPASGPSRRS
jgi:hypothetical protein